MIISMEGYDGKWKLIDYVTDLEWEKGILFQSECIDEYKKFTNIRIIDIWEGNGKEVPLQKQVIKIDAIMVNNTHTLILSDGPVYILNDTGKTIERLN